MNILILEDDLYTSEIMKEDIELCLNKVIEPLSITVCNTIYDANNAIEKIDFDYIISDLNMNPDGLDEFYLDETLGAIATGWVWVHHYVLEKDKDTFIIFYSAFTDTLKNIEEYQKYAIKSKILDKCNYDSSDIAKFILDHKKECLKTE